MVAGEDFRAYSLEIFPGVRWLGRPPVVLSRRMHSRGSPRESQPRLLAQADRGILSRLCFPDPSKCLCLVDGHVIGLIALDEVLGLVLRCMPPIPLEDNLRGDFPKDDTRNSAGLRIPGNAIANAQPSRPDVQC